MAALANGLAEANRPVDFIAVSPRGAGALRLSPQVRQIILTQKWWCARSFRQQLGREELKAYLRRTRPAILLAGGTNIHLIAVLATRAVDQPPALVLRADRHPNRNIPWNRPLKRFKDFLRRPIDRWTYDRADLVVALSEEIAGAIRSKMRHPERCIILPNPVVTDSFLQSLDSDPPHPWLRDGPPVILGVGRLVLQKDFATLLKAMAAVIRRRPARLVILGEGGLRAALEQQADELGIGEHIDMPGQVTDVGPWMKHARLLVSSSRYEGLPAAIVEAFAAGCPVVATRCPGASADLLAKDEGGLLVPVADPAEMAAAIDHLLQKKTDRRKLSALSEPYFEGSSIQAHIDVLDEIEAEWRGRAVSEELGPVSIDGTTPFSITSRSNA
jgi:glycosyltransferase involved in cell wall biosynthesis